MIAHSQCPAQSIARSSILNSPNIDTNLVRERAQHARCPDRRHTLTSTIRRRVRQNRQQYGVQRVRQRFLRLLTRIRSWIYTHAIQKERFRLAVSVRAKWRLTPSSLAARAEIKDSCVLARMHTCRVECCHSPRSVRGE